MVPSTAEVSAEISFQIQEAINHSEGKPVNIEHLARHCTAAAGAYMLFGRPYCRDKDVCV